MLDTDFGRMIESVESLKRRIFDIDISKRYIV